MTTHIPMMKKYIHVRLILSLELQVNTYLTSGNKKNLFDSLTLGEYLPVLPFPTLCCDVINNDRKKDLNFKSLE